MRPCDRPCDTCGNLVLGEIEFAGSRVNPPEYGPDRCVRGHDPDNPPEDCEDRSAGRPMTAEEYTQERYWASDERV